MTPRLGLVILALVLAGCPLPTTTEVVEDLKVGREADVEARPRLLGAGQAVVILSDDGNPEGWVVACVHEKIKRRIPEGRIVSEQKFRDALFPWFEPETVPGDEKAFAETLARPVVVERLATMRIAYLVTLGAASSPAGGRSPPAVAGRRGLAAGIGFAKLRSAVGARIWDVGSRALAGTISAASEGSDIVVLPLWFHAYTEQSACGALGERIAAILLGEKTD